MEQYVLDHMVVFDCATFALLTMYGILFVSWFFDTKIWDFFTDLPEELQVFSVIFGIIFSVWYTGCAIFGWEYRVIPHVIGTFIMGSLSLLTIGVIAFRVIVDLREEVVDKRRRNRH